MTTAILPLKDLVQAKSRLAGVLSASERRALAQAMAEDVLAVLAANSDVSRVYLVSDDPGAAMLARSYGAHLIAETELGCRGLNPVLHGASSFVHSRHPGEQMILHADIPLVSEADLSRVFAARKSNGGVVIGPDRRGEGTNLLAFDSADPLQFCFGQDSCAQHIAMARGISLPHTCVHTLGIGLDVDEPADLAELLAVTDSTAGARTRAMLLESGVAGRLRLTLAGLREAAPGRAGGDQAK